MRVNPGTGRIYQLSPTSRLGSTPIVHQAPGARRAPAAAPVVKPQASGFFSGLLGGVQRALGRAAEAVSGLFGKLAQLMTGGDLRQLEASGRGKQTSSGSGVV